MIADPRLRRPGPALALLGPLVAVMLAWRGLVPVAGAGNCASNPLATLADWNALDAALETARRMLAGMGAYALAFKLPLSGAALLESV
ncbi:hypothetical protein [Magnetospirillum sp. 15-1]|uniref:hypothetical protein n=1 Tax=Magnetospirillum sp. 15-1 TaxID=1979370 RepID=UPI001143FB1B|nr:hypothetical protein [Magnetospirillum sp. 15-1]